MWAGAPLHCVLPPNASAPSPAYMTFPGKERADTPCSKESKIPVQEFV